MAIQSIVHYNLSDDRVTETRMKTVQRSRIIQKFTQLPAAHRLIVRRKSFDSNFELKIEIRIGKSLPKGIWSLRNMQVANARESLSPWLSPEDIIVRGLVIVFDAWLYAVHVIRDYFHLPYDKSLSYRTPNLKKNTQSSTTLPLVFGIARRSSNGLRVNLHRYDINISYNNMINKFDHERR